MPDVFISYSMKDEELAQFVNRHLQNENLDVFLASISLKAGERWTSQILEALKYSKWVFFLASKNALASKFVQQELGAALITNKKLVPIMWDIEQKELPGWVSNYQGINLKGQTLESINHQVASLAARIKADKLQGQLVAGVIFAGLLYLLSK